MPKKWFANKNNEICEQNEWINYCRKIKLVFAKCNFVRKLFANKRKSTYKIFVSAWFSVWTSQGLNLGPPDYESVALTNWATSPFGRAHFAFRCVELVCVLPVSGCPALIRTGNDRTKNCSVTVTPRDKTWIAFWGTNGCHSQNADAKVMIFFE